jgi:multicomponent Na+:H+ antiporter subunit F
MFVAAIVAVLAAMALAVARAVLGPTAFDRLLAANSIGTFAIMLLALYGFLTDRPEFLDLGITYALLNMIGTLAVLKFFRYGWLGYDHREGDTEHKG